MHMAGEALIGAPRERVWDALNDPEILKACIPGCESLEKLSDTELKATVKQKIGPVSAKFNGTVILSDLDPPNGYTISGEGQGGVAGFAKGGATVRLEANGADTTVLKYDAKAQVGGKLAQLGGRLIDATAKKLADQFFKNFAETVGKPAEAAPAEAVAAAAVEAPAAGPAKPAPAPAAEPAQGLAAVPQWAWIAGGVVLLIIIVAFVF